jgi:hypothetical protein
MPLNPESVETGSSSNWMARIPNWFWVCLAAVATIVFIVRSGSAIHTFSQTFDEPYHIGAGLAIYEARGHVAGVQHGPIARIVAALPLYIAGVRAPLDSTNRHEVRKEGTAFEMGEAALFDGKTPYWRVLTLARWAMLLVFPPICLWYVFLLGRLLAGPRSAGWRVGAVAVVFFSLDPTFLGHSFLVCTDVPGCAAFLAALYYGLRWLAFPSWPRAIAAAIALGLAVACKFSCLEVVIALFVVAVLGCGKALYSMSEQTVVRPGFDIRQIVAMCCIAFASLWAAYFFAVGKLSNQDLFRPVYWNHVPAFIANLTVPMPAFFLGLLYLLGHEHSGHATYLNGHVSQSGHWYYFPEAIALKEPIAVITAVLIGIVLLLCLSAERRRWRVAASILVPAVLFLGAAMKGNLNLGIRHILPLLPCMYLFACLLILGPLAEQTARAASWRITVLAMLVLITCVETIPQAPDYIAYFNVIAGGPIGGRRYLADSNLDWGQDFGLLAAYLRSPQNAGRTYSISAFDQHPEMLAAAFGLRPDSVTGTPRGLFALTVNSAVQLNGYRVDIPGAPDVHPPDYSWVKRYPHAATIGTCFDVYDLDAAPAK